MIQPEESHVYPRHEVSHVTLSMEKVNGTSQLCYGYVSSVSWSNDPIKGMKYALNGYIHCT